MTPRTVLFTAVAIAATAAACSSPWLQKAERGVANVVLPVPDEIALGNKLAAEVEKDNKLHKSEAVQNYVSDVGERVAAKAKDTPKGIRFHFKVIDDDKTVNAFALPGGKVYVYSGLLKLADDESELAAVLGHEIAHVTQRHVAERLVAAYGLQTVLGLAVGQNPGLLAQIAAQIVGGGSMLKFSRVQESDADSHGLPYAVAAGYDPHGFIRLFGKLKKGEGPGYLVFLQDHPLPSERIDDVKAMIAHMKNPPDRRNKDEYVAMQEKL